METSTILAFIIAIIFFILYYFRGQEIKVIKNREVLLMKESETLQFERETFFRKEIEDIQSKLNDTYKNIPILANQQFDEFKNNEIESLRAVLSAAAAKTALADLEAWKTKYEMFYRQDAINRSQSVILGKVTEHLIPFHQNFPFNPKEARFIGSPIDMIVFEGIENEDVVDIYILEIKTGKSSLSKRQRLIRDAVENDRVSWRELNV
ncbi:Predicted secreted endonuclease [Hymenobacter daecheongensis DSM 21074]|uniref:Predicted secreted endonuclease n=1 Tax=Hymenobacter daecheongensis DSM 21074 TaxID=1121955 RepID=A0A1M6MEY7_9BACT|nr:Holliday junction resolvase-like protein [Hymenobacter daecheongensis]SHJ81916.1 Predicted secreted endonuclease [Hymenobacter daecheongensis DSM 21074]